MIYNKEYESGMQAKCIITGIGREAGLLWADCAAYLCRADNCASLSLIIIACSQ